jgi:HK97 family phage portal protein
MKFRLFDGRKTYTEEDYKWRSISSGSHSDTYKLYTSVPFLYRAIDIRAKTLASMPYKVLSRGNDVTDNAVYAPIIDNIHKLIYRTEGALCLYGRAYWTKDVKNRIPVPVWLLPTLVQPFYQSGRGLVRYDYYASIDSVYSSKHIQFNPDELVSFELPSLGTEGWYGIAPAYVASMSAQSLYELDKFTSKFFGSGAIKATILSVEGNPTIKQRDELRHWFDHLVSGVARAWSTAVLNSKVEPKIIGEGISELKDGEIAERREKHICAALGIPHSLVSADAANYATAKIDQLNFYTHTIIPEIKFLFEQINNQLLNSYNLELIPDPTKLEVFQQAELEKSQAISQLLPGKEIMLINEARAMLELPPLEEKEEEKNSIEKNLPQHSKFLKAVKELF